MSGSTKYKIRKSNKPATSACNSPSSVSSSQSPISIHFSSFLPLHSFSSFARLSSLHPVYIHVLCSLHLRPLLLLGLLQLLLSSNKVQIFTFFPRVFVMFAQNRGIGRLTNQTNLVESKVGCAAVSPPQGHLVLL